MAKFKIALCQHDVRDSVSENLRTAAESVRKAARRGADIAVLPEMFICHFVPAQMRFFAQTLSGDVVKALEVLFPQAEVKMSRRGVRNRKSCTDLRRRMVFRLFLPLMPPFYTIPALFFRRMARCRGVIGNVFYSMSIFRGRCAPANPSCLRREIVR